MWCLYFYLREGIPKCGATVFNKTLFLRIWAVIFGLLGAPIALLSGGFTLTLVWVALASLVLAMVVFVVVSLFGNKMGDALLGLGKTGHPRERLASDLLKARHAFAEGKLVAAMEIIDGVLAIDPNFSDALLVQAQVALKAGEDEQARVVFQHILKVCKRDDVNRRWALNYLRDMNEAAGK